jgi:arsenate reductase
VKHLLGERWEARSAGTAPAVRVHPLAGRALAEVGVDISGETPEHVGGYLDQGWDLVVTVCDAAQETCPAFPRPVPKLHISFLDPAAAEGTDEAKMAVFRRVRDEIRDFWCPRSGREAEDAQRPRAGHRYAAGRVLAAGSGVPHVDGGSGRWAVLGREAPAALTRSPAPASSTSPGDPRGRAG